LTFRKHPAAGAPHRVDMPGTVRRALAERPAMTHAPDIRFIGMEPCGAIASVARDQAEALDRAYRSITCFQVAISLDGLGGTSVYEALREAFDTTDRQLRDSAQRLQ
jgi:hypothetical protein